MVIAGGHNDTFSFSVIINITVLLPRYFERLLNRISELFSFVILKGIKIQMKTLD